MANVLSLLYLTFPYLHLKIIIIIYNFNKWLRPVKCKVTSFWQVIYISTCTYTWTTNRLVLQTSSLFARQDINNKIIKTFAKTFRPNISSWLSWYAVNCYKCTHDNKLAIIRPYQTTCRGTPHFSYEWASNGFLRPWLIFAILIWSILYYSNCMMGFFNNVDCFCLKQ